MSLKLRNELENTRTTPQGLAKMARKLGYRDRFQQMAFSDGSCVGDLLEFFEDNPGACEAVVNWVLEQGLMKDGSPIDEDEDEDEDEEQEHAS